MFIVTRKKAIELGLNRYFTGKTCKWGHTDYRYVNQRRCCSCARRDTREWAKRNRARLRKYKRELRHGQYSEATRLRPANCELCSNPPTGRKTVLSFDHDHSAGKFRGWLCDNCNQGIGLLGDNIEGLKKALRYLQDYEDRNSGICRGSDAREGHLG